ncbi:5-oxoprolinase subunit PxpB [Neobacillus sp. OS1-33]|uniref:5-oxoprolinase subunit PxpB n=1 Tax=Neobacillus sp. OS1-33 TaxID=3070683 RepID=UPI0027DFDCDB|nr:5-oxoprolinase subunit PxpB [Neobacillus sp. OS1-33]WML28528.1 5-oxoprolinase subunit PxpB [Neobacillus sp. OS1-33]
MDIQPLGDLAIRVCFGEGINETIHKQVQSFTSRLHFSKINGIVECVPAYHSVAIYYRPELISYTKLVAVVVNLCNTSVDVNILQPIVYEIPVYYGGKTGQDLPFVAQYHQMSEDEVINLHANKEYLIYLIGFVPGFPYLGGLSQQLSVPRLDHPRPRVPAGSVGIGGNQTGIYPSEVPSGWRIIGITPVNIFDLENPNLISAGNYIKFFPITRNEYQRIKNLSDEKKYKLSTYLKEGG